MSTRLKTLIDEQNTLWTRMQEIQRVSEDEKRDWTAEERTNWDAAEERLTVVSSDIERLDRAAKLEQVDYRQVVDARVSDGERPQETDEERSKAYDDAFFAYMRNGMSELPVEQKKLLRSGFIKNENRAGEQGVGTPAAGGYLVPEGFRAQITETMKAYGGLLNHANVITTATGNNLPWPKNDDTGNVGALLTEHSAVPDQGVVFGEEELGAYTYTSKMVKVGWLLLNDSAFDLPSFLGRKLGERIGRAWAAHLVSGTGSSQPTGLVANCTAGVTQAPASASAALTYDNLIDLEHSVDPAYRNNGRARYVLSDGALKLIRKLKDGDDRPLWVPIPAPGFASTVNGYQYTVDNSMDAPAPGGRSVIFGDIFSGYVVRQVQGIQMVRLDERYAEMLQTGFFAFARMDAVPDDTAAVKALVFAAAA